MIFVCADLANWPQLIPYGPAAAEVARIDGELP
jgi:hypothetical protein